MRIYVHYLAQYLYLRVRPPHTVCTAACACVFAVVNIYSLIWQLVYRLVSPRCVFASMTHVCFFTSYLLSLAIWSHVVDLWLSTLFSYFLYVLLLSSFFQSLGTPVYGFRLMVFQIVQKYMSESISTASEVGVVAIGPIANLCVYICLVGLGALFHKVSACADRKPSVCLLFLFMSIKWMCLLRSYVRIITKHESVQQPRPPFYCLYYCWSFVTFTVRILFCVCFLPTAMKSFLHTY